MVENTGDELMSKYYKDNGAPYVPEYKDGRTKQSFKDQCDINKLLRKAQRTGAISHLEQFGGQYGDFSDFDFHEQQNRLAAGRQIFEALPSEIRREFSQDPAEFFEFVNNPENTDRLEQLMPGLAEPGNQAPDVIRTAQNQLEPKTQDMTPTTEETAPEAPQTPTE